MRRAAKAAAGLTLGGVGWLTLAPIVQAVCLRRLRTVHPEYFEPAAAGRAVKAAITQDTE